MDVREWYKDIKISSCRIVHCYHCTLLLCKIIYNLRKLNKKYHNTSKSIVQVYAPYTSNSNTCDIYSRHCLVLARLGLRMHTISEASSGYVMWQKQKITVEFLESSNHWRRQVQDYQKVPTLTTTTTTTSSSNSNSVSCSGTLREFHLPFIIPV